MLALGLVGAGTNNSRLAGMLRNLASYYYKEPSMLFLVRVAQGLVHMGKGLLTTSPWHTDRQLLSGECSLFRVSSGPAPMRPAPPGFRAALPGSGLLLLRGAMWEV